MAIEPLGPRDYDRAHRHFQASFENNQCLGGTLDEPCQNAPINSHTIAKRWLRPIARRSHVYHPALRIAMPDVRNPFDLVGINNASTKRLFCSDHDGELFRPLESSAFTINTQNTLLLHFRAICSELAAKLGSNILRATTIVHDDGTPAGRAAAQEWAIASIGQELGLRDIAEHYRAALQSVRDGDLSKIRYLALEFSNTLPYAYVGSFIPEFDFRGRALADLADVSTIPDGVCASAFSDGGRGYVVLTWEKDATHAQTLASSLIGVANEKKAEAGLIIGLEHLENSCFNPDWWEGLSGADRQRHLTRFSSAANPEQERTSTCLSIMEPLTTGVQFDRFRSNDGALVLLT